MILKRYLDLVFLNLFAVTFYFVMLYIIGIDVSEEVMFSTVDGNSYREVANWILTGEDTPYIGVRPFLYPLVISIVNIIGGVKGIWILQFLLWLMSSNLIYLSIFRLTKKKYLGYVGGFIFIVNLSLISLTLHALSEVMTAFLLSVLVFHLVRNRTDLTSIRSFHGGVLILSLLTVVRPMFLLPLVGLLGVLLFVKFKTYFKGGMKFFWLGIVLLPVFVQMGILKWNYDEYGISMRSSDTVDYYLMAQSIQQEKNIELSKAREIVTEMSISERSEYKVNHLRLMSRNLFRNIADNIKGDSYMLIYRPEVENTLLRKIVVSMNVVFLQIHRLFLLATFLFMLFLLRKKSWNELLLIFVLTLLPFYYIVASGVSFWQGDRLVVPAMSIWIVAYIFIFDEINKRRLIFISKKSKP